MTTQSVDQQQRDAQREAEQTAALLRGKQAAAQRQADARAVHAAELAARKAADKTMGIGANWSEPRKHLARQKYADAQRAAQVEAVLSANPSKSYAPAHGQGFRSTDGILRYLMRGSMRPGVPFSRH